MTSCSNCDEIIAEEQKPMVNTKFCGMIQASRAGAGPHHENVEDISQLINQSQLHQSRCGLLSQALMMMITVGFLLSETLSESWKPKVDLKSQNTHDFIFCVVEIGVALWFPCVLWNCIRPEQLWILNLFIYSPARVPFLIYKQLQQLTFSIFR